MSEEKRIKIFTERMKQLREEKGQKENRIITQAVASKEMGIHVNSLINYEFDRFPKIDQLIKIKDYYKVSYEYLLGETNIQKPDFNYQSIGKITGLSDYAIEVLEFSKLNEKNDLIVPTINFLLEQEENQEVSDKMYEYHTKDSLDDDESIDDFNERYQDVKDFIEEWEKNHFPVLEYIATYLNAKPDDKFVYTVEATGDVPVGNRKGNISKFELGNRRGWMFQGNRVITQLMLADIQDVFIQQRKHILNAKPDTDK